MGIAASMGLVFEKLVGVAGVHAMGEPSRINTIFVCMSASRKMRRAAVRLN